MKIDNQNMKPGAGLLDGAQIGDLAQTHQPVILVTSQQLFRPDRPDQAQDHRSEL